MTAPLLATKLYMPSLRPESVPRPRLVERLNAGLNRRLTLVSAPAGFGKTTLVVEWLHDVRMQGEVGARGDVRAHGRAPLRDNAPARDDAPLRAAWLSLDEDDNDPARFTSYLIAALETVQPGVGGPLIASGEARALLHSPQPPPLKSILTLLINDLAAAPDRLVLVLDDAHVIRQPSIHDAITYLVERLPPQVHLVLAGRTDPPLPLARLRTRGQLTEIRADDLRFTAQEAAAFLNEAMGLDLSTADIEALETRTEGWISALQLAALQLQGLRTQAHGTEDLDRRRLAAARKSDFVAAFSGSHRHVIDYLAEEVLAQQPSEIHDFICQTAILDRLTPPLCNAVTGRQDSDMLLERLERANLFLIPLDDERRWYRYHRLFADFCRGYAAQAFPDRVHDLHCWAAEWYEHNGFPAEAVGHALQAGEFEWAARTIEGTALATLMRGEVATVLGWLGTLPGELVHTRPRLCIAYAAAWTVAGRLDEIETYLQTVERSIQAPGQAGERDALAGQVTVVRAYLATLQGDLNGAIRLVEGVQKGYQASAQLAPDDAFFTGIISWLRGMAQYFNRGSGAAGEAFAEAIRLSRETGSTLMTLLSIYASGYLHVIQGCLRRARECFEEGLRLATSGPQTPVGDQTPSENQFPALGASLIAQGLGEVAREQNDLHRADRWMDACIQWGERWGNPEPLADSYVLYARVKHALGDIAGARAFMDKAVQLGREAKVAGLTVRQIEAHQARLWLAAGDLEKAARWAEVQDRRRAAEPEAEGQMILYVRGLEERVLAQLYIAQGRYERAARLLEPLLADLEAAGWTGVAIEALALQGLALQGLAFQGLALQDRPLDGRALESLHRALLLAEAEGFARVFLDQGQPMAGLLSTYRARRAASAALRAYTERLLAAFERERALPDREQAPTPNLKPETWPTQNVGPELIEPLTGREREVLSLVAAGLSNREIAERLTITVGTAKRHVSNIYAKLDVHSRVQAAARARELGL